MKREVFGVLACMISVFLLTGVLIAQDAETEEPADSEETSAAISPATNQICKAAILMEATSGDIIYELNSHEPLPPASMVKLMVAYITMKKIKEGAISAEDIITTSAFASKIGGSQVYLKEGEQFTVLQLLEAVMIQSANDASTALAEHIGGSSAGFVEMMNAEAQTLGMKETTFQSPHGLPPGKDQKIDLVSAHDFALLARAILTKHPEITEFSKKEKAEFREGKFIMTNTNRMVKNYPGCDGLKTGFCQEAGFCVTSTAERNGIRMIAVVMGCENGKKRFEEAARLLSLGFSKYKTIALIKKGSQAKAPVPVKNGIKKETIPVATMDVAATIRIEDESEIVQKTTLYKEISAPVAPQTECGNITFFVREREIGRVPLVTQEEIPELGFWGKTLRMIGLR